MRWPATALAIGLLAWPAAASAATTWWVETRPWTCAAQTAPLARQVQLACDATNRCAIAPKAEAAERRAVLVCADDAWSLEVRDADDRELWTLDLGNGDDEARLRKAAVWIARSEGDARATAASAPPPAAGVQTAPPPPQDAEHTPAVAPPSRFALAAALHASSSKALGVRGVATVRPAGPLLLGVAGTAEHDNEFSTYRGGVVAGASDSAGAFRLGVAIEGGPALRSAPTSLEVSPGHEPQEIGGKTVLAYAQASLLAQWSLAFVSPSVTWFSDRQTAIGLDLGLVWGAI